MCEKKVNIRNGRLEGVRPTRAGTVDAVLSDAVLNGARRLPGTFSRFSCSLVDVNCSGPARHPSALIGSNVLMFAADCVNIISAPAKGGVLVNV